MVRALEVAAGPVELGAGLWALGSLALAAEMPVLVEQLSAPALVAAPQPQIPQPALLRQMWRRDKR